MGYQVGCPPSGGAARLLNCGIEALPSRRAAATELTRGDPSAQRRLAAAAEAMNLAASLNMDLHQVIEVISKCAGSSWMFENRAPHIADGDYTPLSSVNIFVKDLGIVTDEASRHEAVTPLSDAALSLYQKASESGLGSEDDSAIVKILAQRSNGTLPGSDT